MSTAITTVGCGINNNTTNEGEKQMINQDILSAQSQVPSTLICNQFLLKPYIPKQSNYPFIMHASVHCSNCGSFPTHTHGLADKGMPEFIIDPLAFGPEGNPYIIRAAYNYFKKRKNAFKLKMILNGKTVKVTGKKLKPKLLRNDRHNYCFREVTADFQAVKEAYPNGVEPGTRFIQIYVDGDDFALTDEYYRGGVTW
jgi:hypothetical protein